jgi:hypothetical protein
VSRSVRTRVAALVLLAASLSACGAARGGGSGSRNLITTADIVRVNAHTAYEAIARLQPQWLASRGPVSLTNPTPTEVSVYVSGIQAGGISYLQNLDVSMVVEMRYYAPGDASARFGIGHPRGVIDVRLKGN